jgi:hypothetical protein
VQHRGDADAGAEVLGIGRDGGHGLGRGREQDVVDRGLVLVGDVGDLGRQREHHMEVPHRQQVGLARSEPCLGGGALALRAMPVAATVVGDDRMSAVFTSSAAAVPMDPFGPLLDHLIGGGQQCFGDGKAERLGGLEVDHIVVNGLTEQAPDVL